MCCLCPLPHRYPQQQQERRETLHQRVTAASLRTNRSTDQTKNYGMYVPHFYIDAWTQKQDHVNSIIYLSNVTSTPTTALNNTIK